MTDRGTASAEETARRASASPAGRPRPSARAKAEVGAIVRQSRSSFQTGMRLLPPQRRMAMYAVYAFCRLIDDIADGPDDVDVKTADLDAWERKIDAVFAPSSAPSAVGEHPVAEVLRWAVWQYDLPRAEFEAVIAGMRWDVERPAVAPGMDELLLYARHVAGAVGLLSLRIFGVEHAESHRFAIVLGEALQLTNVLRDVDEDAAFGRVYVPAPCLGERGVLVRDPQTVVSDPGFPAACADLAVLARDRFSEARLLAGRIGSPRLAPAMVMMSVYGHLLGVLTARGWAAPRTPASINRAHKAALALRAAAIGWRWPSLT